MNRILVYLDIIVPFVSILVSVFYLLSRRVTIHVYDFTLLFFYFSQFILNSTANGFQDYKINNHWVYHINSLITQIIFTYYFLNSYHNEKWKTLTVISFVLYIIFGLFNMVFFQRPLTFNSYSYAFGVLWIVFFSLESLHILLSNPELENIFKFKDFWIATGILFYFGISFFIFISYNYLSAVSPQNVGVLWKIHNIFLSIGCILFLKAIFAKKWIPK